MGSSERQGTCDQTRPRAMPATVRAGWPARKPGAGAAVGSAVHGRAFGVQVSIGMFLIVILGVIQIGKVVLPCLGATVIRCVQCCQLNL